MFPLGHLSPCDVRSRADETNVFHKEATGSGHQKQWHFKKVGLIFKNAGSLLLNQYQKRWQFTKRASTAAGLANGDTSLALWLELL